MVELPHETVRVLGEGDAGVSRAPFGPRSSSLTPSSRSSWFIRWVSEGWAPRNEAAARVLLLHRRYLWAGAPGWPAWPLSPEPDCP